MNTKFKSLLGIFIAAAIMVACDEEDPLANASQAEIETELGEFLVSAESQANFIYKFVDEALRDSTFRADDTATIRGAQVTRLNDDVKIDFGVGVSGSDGLVRKGIIDLSITGSDFLNQGAMVSGSFNQFKVDNKAVGGTFTIENKGNNTFESVFTNISFNAQFSMNATKSVVWQNGIGTPKDPTDDKYQISGTSDGSLNGGANTVAANITSPFIFDKACQYGLVSGVMDVSFTGDSLTYNNGVIDFLASDACNNIYELQLSGTDGSNVNLPLTFNGF